jgi:hypothetical protein
VPGVLELAQLVEHDAVAQVQVWTRGIDAELDAQGPLQGQLALQLTGRKGIDDVAQQGSGHSRRW